MASFGVSFITHTIVNRGFQVFDRTSGDSERNGDFATVKACSLRIAFVPVVVFLVAVAFLFVLLIFIGLFSKEDISGY